MCIKNADVAHSRDCHNAVLQTSLLHFSRKEQVSLFQNRVFAKQRIAEVRETREMDGWRMSNIHTCIPAKDFGLILEKTSCHPPVNFLEGDNVGANSIKNLSGTFQ